MNEFERLLPKIKEIVLPTIVESLQLSPIIDEIPDDVMSKDIFIHLLGLAYNDEDINATLNDLMPNRNPFIYTGTDQDNAFKMAMLLVAYTEDFKFQLMAIKGAMKNALEELPEREVLLNVKMLLFHA